MNEKIAELLRKNEIYHDTHLIVDYNSSGSRLEKLIEFVIKECGSVVERQLDYDANWCDDKIKNHFGIE